MLNSFFETEVPGQFLLLKITLNTRSGEKTAALTQHTGKSTPMESIRELREVISEIQRQVETKPVSFGSHERRSQILGPYKLPGRVDFKPKLGRF